MDEFLAEYLKDPDNLRGFQRADLQIEIALQVERAMKKQKVSRKELAARMGVSKGRITQILCGTSNLTLRLVADAFTALGMKLEIKPVALGYSESTIDAKSLELPAPQQPTAQNHTRNCRRLDFGDDGCDK